MDIEIHFFYSAHAEVTGDPDFDGRGGQLAHAYLPNTGSVTIDYVDGDVHLDAAELWTINYSSSKLLLRTLKLFMYNLYIMLVIPLLTVSVKG